MIGDADTEAGRIGRYSVRAQVPCALAFAVSVKPLATCPASWPGPIDCVVGVGARLVGPAGRGVELAGGAASGGAVVVKDAVVVKGPAVGAAASSLAVRPEDGHGARRRTRASRSQRDNANQAGEECPAGRAVGFAARWAMSCRGAVMPTRARPRTHLAIFSRLPKVRRSTRRLAEFLVAVRCERVDRIATRFQTQRFAH